MASRKIPGAAPIKMMQVSVNESLRFMVDCLRAAGADSEPAMQQSELLLHADKAGHPSHGLNRLEFYINDIKKGVCDPNNKPKILKETVSTAWIDAGNVLGATASHFAMDVAIKKAKETGIGWVTVKGSNHFGMAGYWCLKPAKEGLVGMAFTNTSPLLTPTRSKKSALGTNPIAVSAPGCDDELFLLDMATTAVAVGKIEIKKRSGEPLPPGWAQDPDGNETTDADLAFKTSSLMPLGGREINSGYKGYGLAAMVEILCGISAGSNYGHHIRSWSQPSDKAANLGHCFIVMNPECFAPGFAERITESMRYWRNLPATNPDLPVLAPGDKEKTNIEVSEKRGTVFYLEQQIRTAAALAEKLKVAAPKLVQVSICESMRFMVDCLRAVGANYEPAQQQSKMLMHADKAGHPSHGLNRLEVYINDIRMGICYPNNKPKVLKETVSTAWVDGCSVLGASASHFAVDIAIKKAKETGTGWVTVKGTNPLALAAPGSKGELYLLDMATTVVALGKLEIKRRAGEPLPAGWALGPDGKDRQTDAELALETECLLPLGGHEVNSGYKGYGLAAMVEILCGISAGSNYGHYIKSWSGSSNEPANIGHCFIAMNPECFAPGFGDRIADALRHWRRLSRADPNLPVLAPGDKERQSVMISEKRGTVFYLEQQIKSAAVLAEKLKVKPIEIYRNDHNEKNKR